MYYCSFFVFQKRQRWYEIKNPAMKNYILDRCFSINVFLINHLFFSRLVLFCYTHGKQILVKTENNNHSLFCFFSTIWFLVRDIWKAVFNMNGNSCHCYFLNSLNTTATSVKSFAIQVIRLYIEYSSINHGYYFFGLKTSRQSLY